MKISAVTLFGVSTCALASLLNAAKAQLASGYYSIFAISDPGFTIGVVPGPFIGVQSASGNDLSTNKFAVVEHPNGYVLHLAAGGAIPDGQAVGLNASSPGSFWNITTVDGGLYSVATADNLLVWILPHDAPVGTPISLTTPVNPLIPSEFFDFVPWSG